MNQENLLKFAAATNNELYDPEFRGGEWMVEAAETHETIDDFKESSMSWAEKTGEKHGEIAGLKFVAWATIQPAKGAARRQLSVIDLGDIRVALDVDLTNFI